MRMGLLKGARPCLRNFGLGLRDSDPRTRKVSAGQSYKDVTALNKDDPPAEALRVQERSDNQGAT